MSHKIFVGFFFLSLNLFAQDTCLNWFQASRVKSNSKDCPLKCALIPKNMSTFYCADRCDEFCKNKKCLPDFYWKNKLKNGTPKDWDVPTEQSTNWTDQETVQIMNILNLMPNRLKELSIDGIFRMKKSSNIINPASTAKNGKAITVYDRAFHNPFWSLNSVITHELGHVVFLSFSQDEQKSYLKTLGWKQNSGNEDFRTGDFISSRAKDDSSEDFAENFSFFLLSRDVLKSKVPKAYDWLVKKFTTDLKVKEECEDGKN